MYFIKKLTLTTLLAAAMQMALALPNFRAETTPPPNAGAISAEELGPVFSHPFGADEPTAAPKTSEKQEKQQKKDILSLFQNSNKSKTEENNPLEEMAKEEMKALEGPKNQTREERPQVAEEENKEATRLAMKSEKTIKEIDLDNPNPDSNTLPAMLR